MSKTTKNLKKRIKAPRELVSAAKRGERVAPKRKTDTTATHIHRFTKAFAVYACAAVLLVGVSLSLPALLSDPATPLSQPNGSVAQTDGNAAETSSVTAPSETTARVLLEDPDRIYDGDDDLDYRWKDCFVVDDFAIDSVRGEPSVDISGLPTDPTGDKGDGRLNVAPSTFDDSKKATVIAKKVSSESYYHTNYAAIEPAITPLVYTVSTFEIIEVERDSDYYYSKPYEVGRTIKIIEWYGVCPPEDSPTGEEYLYRPYPYSYQGVEMPDLMEIGKTYRLALIDGSALDENDGIAAASCYESGLRRSAVMYLGGCYLVAGDVEEVQ